MTDIEVYFSDALRGASSYQSILEKGEALLKAGRVRAASILIDSDELYFTCLVGAAMKKKVQYAVKMKLQNSGEVLNADCECPAGAGPTAACKHVACFAVLLLDFEKNGTLLIKDSCTSTLQSFHHPPGYSGSPTKSEQMKRPYGGNDLRDPRDPAFRNIAGYQDWVQNHVLAFSYHSGLDIAMRYIIPKADLQVAAQDHAYLEKHFAEYWVDSALHNLPCTQEKEELRDLHEKRKCFEDTERETRGQSSSKMWHYHRKWRLTASTFGTIHHMTERRDINKFFDSLLHPRDLCTKPVTYGRNMESEALSTFEKKTGVATRKCGLFINEDFPYLAATPDAVTESGDAVIEIKCPYSCKDKVITAESLPYLEISESGMKLKFGSDYFCQIQGQMAVTKIHKAYFVLFSSKTLFVEEVPFDQVFWAALLAKLKVVYAQYRSFIAHSL